MRVPTCSWILLACLCIGCGERVPPVDATLHPHVREVLEQGRRRVVAAPGSAAAWGLYGMLLDAHDCRTAAGRCYRRAVAIEPAVAWYHLEGLLVEPGDPVAAERLFRRAAEIDPRAAEPRLRLAELLVDSGRPAEALAALDFEPQDDATAAHRAFVAARCAESLGQLDRARAEASEAVRLAPGLRQVHESAARLFARLGDEAAAAAAVAGSKGLPAGAVGWPDAYRDAVRRLRADPHREAEAARAHRETAATDAALERLFREHPDDWTFAADLARRRLAAGELAAAIAIASDALAVHPGAVELRKLRAAARLLREEWSAASADLTEAVARRPGDAAAWSDLAFAQQQLGMIEAEASLRRAITLSPLVAADRVRLVELLLERGNVAAAREGLRSLAELEPGHPDLAALTGKIERAATESGGAAPGP